MKEPSAYRTRNHILPKYIAEFDPEELCSPGVSQCELVLRNICILFILKK